MMYKGTLSLDRIREIFSDIVDDLGGPDAFHFIVASGGRVHGNAHGYSDLDFYGWPKNPDQTGRVWEIDGLVVQLNNIVESDLEDIGKCYRFLDYHPKNRRQMWIHIRLAKLASRILTGVQLCASPEGSDYLTQIYPEVYRKLVMCHSAQVVSRMLEDAAGAIEVGDAEIANLATVQALTASAESALAAVGDLQWGEALLWRRLKNNPKLKEVNTLVRNSLHIVTSPEDENWQESARRACHVASVLVSTSQLEGWDKPAEGITGLGGAGKIISGEWSTDPFCAVAFYTNSVAIAGHDRGMRTNKSSAKLWLRINELNKPKYSTIDAFASKGLASTWRDNF